MDYKKEENQKKEVQGNLNSYLALKLDSDSPEDILKHLNEILKTFNNPFIKVSDILSILDVSIFASRIEQRVSVYSTESMLKLILYRRIKGIQNYNKLIAELEQDKISNLGLTAIPTKQNFNYFIKTKINNTISDTLDTIAEKILAVATQTRHILDLDIIKKNIKDYRNKAREERKVLNESTKLLKRLFYPQIKINISKNSKFTTKDLLDILVHVAETHDFANNGCKTFKDLNEDLDVPDGDTLLYHLKKLDSKEEIREVFDNITDLILNFAKKNYKLLRGRRLDIAYDVHKICYYGDKNTEYIKGGKHENGTSYFHQFLTCDIVIAGKRFTIDVVPIHPLDEIPDLLDYSLKRVKVKIPIDRVFLDRGFANSKCINVLKENNVHYVMPMPRNDKVKQWMDKSEDCKARLIEDFEIGDKAITNLYLVDDKEGIKRVFITNLKVPILLSHYFYIWYGERWGIETGYRLKAQDFRLRTTSRSFNLRLFYFLFSVMLYNLWVISNIIVGVKLYGRFLDKPIITAKRFVLMLEKVKDEYVVGG